MADQNQQMTKEAAEAKMRAFSMGVGRFCEDAGISYEDLAKTAGVTPEQLAPALADILADAAQQHQG